MWQLIYATANAGFFWNTTAVLAKCIPDSNNDGTGYSNKIYNMPNCLTPYLHNHASCLQIYNNLTSKCKYN